MEMIFLWVAVLSLAVGSGLWRLAARRDTRWLEGDVRHLETRVAVLEQTERLRAHHARTVAERLS